MKAFICVLCLLFPVTVFAQTGQLEIKDVWVRATAGKADTGAVYMTIISAVPDQLLSASTPVANKTDLMTMEGNSSAMKMTYLNAIDVPANKPISLNSNGLHVWLAGLKQPLKSGETFPLTLNFEKAGKREVTVLIVSAAARGPEHKM